MYRSVVYGCLLFGLVLAVPEDVQGQKKKGNKSGAEPATPQDYSQLMQFKEVVGKLASVDESTRVLSLEVEYQYSVLPDNTKNPNKTPTYPGTGKGAKNLQVGNQSFMEMQRYNLQMAKLKQEQQEAAFLQNPQQRAQKIQSISQQIQRLQVQHQQQLWQQAAKSQGGAAALKGGQVNPNQAKMATASKGFELDAQEKIIVRRQHLPFEYDDKGNPKEFTKDQIAEMRGKDTSLPGYKAKYADLQPGQQIKAYLVNPKAAKKDEAKEADKAKAGEDEGVGNVTKPQVRMVMILTEANGPALANQPEKKKKKN